MEFECKQCVGKIDKPIPTGICNLKSKGGIPTPRGCPYFFARVKWERM